MKTTVLCFLAITSTVYCNDTSIGSKRNGRNIYSGNIVASPAIWKQVHNVTFNATNDEVISCVEITDLRPDKDGESTIVEGGIGHKNVTVELKSPTVFRGYSFHVEIYAASESLELGQVDEANNRSINEPSPSPKTEVDGDETKTSDAVGHSVTSEASVVSSVGTDRINVPVVIGVDSYGNTPSKNGHETTQATPTIGEIDASTTYSTGSTTILGETTTNLPESTTTDLKTTEGYAKAKTTSAN